MPKTRLLRVLLVHFWEHLITYTVVTLLLKICLKFAVGPSEMFFFQGYSVFGLVSYCNPHCKFNCKFRPWRSWAIMLNFFVDDQCTKRHNKNSQPTCLYDFLEKFTRPTPGGRPMGAPGGHEWGGWYNVSHPWVWYVFRRPLIRPDLPYQW